MFSFPCNYFVISYIVLFSLVIYLCSNSFFLNISSLSRFSCFIILYFYLLSSWNWLILFYILSFSWDNPLIWIICYWIICLHFLNNYRLFNWLSNNDMFAKLFPLLFVPSLLLLLNPLESSKSSPDIDSSFIVKIKNFLIDLLIQI